MKSHFLSSCCALQAEIGPKSSIHIMVLIPHWGGIWLSPGSFCQGDTQRHASHPQPSPPKPHHLPYIHTWDLGKRNGSSLLPPLVKVDQKAEPTPPTLPKEESWVCIHWAVLAQWIGYACAPVVLLLCANFSNLYNPGRKCYFLLFTHEKTDVLKLIAMAQGGQARIHTQVYL